MARRGARSPDLNGTAPACAAYRRRRPTRQCFIPADNGYVNKVDAGKLVLPKRSWAPDFSKHPASRAPYRREPYVRARLDDGTTVDAKAIGWTDQHVHLKWQDDDFKMHTRWVPASSVKRISRDESSWRDPYDVID